MDSWPKVILDHRRQAKTMSHKEANVAGIKGGVASGKWQVRSAEWWELAFVFLSY